MWCKKWKNTYENVNHKVSEAQKNITKVTVEELKNIVENNGEITIIDCREKEEYINGHIPGAINVPRGLLEFPQKFPIEEMLFIFILKHTKRASLACPTLKLLNTKC